MQRLADRAAAQGWTVEILRGGHWKWTPPVGRFLISHGSPAGGRAYQNFLAYLKRAGFKP
jgi:hypothetical protein